MLINIKVIHGCRDERNCIIERKTDFEKLCDFDNLYEAYIKAKKGQNDKKEVAYYSINVVSNLLSLQSRLLDGTYELGKYHIFKVYEPKEREVMALPFEDKIVQHCLCDNILIPRLEKTFIYDNFASQKNKGTHKALDRLEEFMHSYYRKTRSIDGWILKCDISKYFYSIKHDILKSQLSKKIKDKEVIRILNMIIDSTEDPGVPIGNQTSQIFALLYLSDMDHFIKEKLNIKYYLRYMDDFILIDENKSKLKVSLFMLKSYLNNFGLKLNNKTQIMPLSQGADMMGFHLYLTETGKVIRKLRRKSKEGMRRKLKKFKKMKDKEYISMEQINQSFTSWKGHASHGNTYNLVKKMDKLYDSLFSEEVKK